MKIVVENIFMCLVLFWKCYFPTNFSHGNSTHDSKLRQSKATTTKTPPPHNHNDNKNQNHIEIKITPRERSVGRRRDRTEARSSGAVRSGVCDRWWDRCDLVRVIVRLELTRSSDAVRSARCCNRRDWCDWCVRLADWSSGFASDRWTGLELEVHPLLLLALSLSLSLSLWKPFEVKIGTEMNFRGQSVFFTVEWNWFPENSIFWTNQTLAFTEKHFRKWFSPKTNTALVNHLY